ncbi:MAG TPA: RagB/SusD family nutrient uptake outer membrane protein [Gemmatimonadaceae bacterium]|nr:RagB/SusD family nutrient uptake outer membrane protein [Gemmatimonadaceae bacterium]
MLIKHRLTTATLGAALLVVGCVSSDRILSVEDPDIINPVDVQSAAGANAVRIGAFARLNVATTGTTNGSDEGLFLLGGMLADEWINGDSFIDRQAVDQRVIQPSNSFLTTADRAINRARLSAMQATQLLKQFAPSAPGWQPAEMYFVEAFSENLMAEDYCNGLVFSSVVNGREQYGSPISDQTAFTLALAHVDSGLPMITGNTTDDLRVKYALQVLRGRILLNLGQSRYAEAATSVAAVPTTFKYQLLESLTTASNVFWSLNNSNRRYSVSSSEGTNGVNFAGAKDPRLPVCQGGDSACKVNSVTQTSRDDLGKPFTVQLLWPTAASPVTIISGVEARMIEAEAQQAAGNPAAAITTLNTARATLTGLAPLTDPGTPAAQIDQIFRERAFWFFSTGHRLGDLRRLIRQYQRSADSVFPTGAWHKGGNYGTDVNIPVPQAELNNPNVPQALCTDRNA